MQTKLEADIATATAVARTTHNSNMDEDTNALNALNELPRQVPIHMDLVEHRKLKTPKRKI